MAEVKFPKGSDEWLLFQDFWKMCQKNWGIEDSDEYWKRVLDDAESFSQKYEHIPLAKEIALAFLWAQEKKYKIEKEGVSDVN